MNKMIRVVIPLTLFLLQGKINFAQTNDLIYQQVDTMPVYSGGDMALHTYLNANLRSPELLKEGEQQYYSICKYIVETDGSVSNIKLLQSTGDEMLDETAVRLISIMPQWTPGKHEGKTVRVERTDTLGFSYKKPTPKADKPQPDVLPQFPGGTEALMKYISKHLIYPIEAASKGIQGRVVCQFTVNENGSISDIQVLNSIDSALDAEAIRIINKMPKWIPGQNNDLPVSVRCTLPIVFRIPTNSTL